MTTRILLVEDSRTQALRLKLELSRHGAEVAVVENGSDGLIAARTTAPSAIVLDIDLPGLDGYSLCRALKTDAGTSAIPVVMLTHRDRAVDARTGLDAGADDYIAKDEFAENNLIISLHALGLL